MAESQGHSLAVEDRRQVDGPADERTVVARVVYPVNAHGATRFLVGSNERLRFIEYGLNVRDGILYPGKIYVSILPGWYLRLFTVFQGVSRGQSPDRGFSRALT
jgi:hypothetical protein